VLDFLMGQCQWRQAPQEQFAHCCSWEEEETFPSPKASVDCELKNRNKMTWQDREGE